MNERNYIVYTASPDGAGYGFVTNAKPLAGYAATLLALPGVSEQALDDAASALWRFVSDENFGNRSRGVSGDATGEMGSIAVSWNPGSEEPSRPGEPGDASFNRAKDLIASTKRAGPMFGGNLRPCVALVVDSDWSRELTLQALRELRSYAHGDRTSSDFLEPLPIKRTLHHLGEILGTTHDGMPVRGAGTTSID